MCIHLSLSLYIYIYIYMYASERGLGLLAIELGLRRFQASDDYPKYCPNPQDASTGGAVEPGCSDLYDLLY